MSTYFTLQWELDHLVLLDQRRLPQEVVYVNLYNVEETAVAIHNMTVRGAPAIGATAAYGIVLAALAGWKDSLSLRMGVKQAAKILLAARPTAVNLGWALKRMVACLDALQMDSPAELCAALLVEANAIADEDRRANRQMGLNALPLLPEEVTFLHHCNTGTLATVEYGTALGVIRTAHEHGKKVFVYVDETRPRLQGSRLTAWELQQLGIPYKIIVDGASGMVMKRCGVNAVVVGCDRVAANGDTANKIGTYNLALVARAHGVPFYVVGPTTTIDLETPTGDEIVIEERDSHEITHINGQSIAPRGAQVYNPAFDVTPAQYISAIITERGVCRPPYSISLPAVIQHARDVSP